MVLQPGPNASFILGISHLRCNLLLLSLLYNSAEYTPSIQSARSVSLSISCNFEPPSVNLSSGVLLD